jgi:hypothetical protein
MLKEQQQAVTGEDRLELVATLLEDGAGLLQPTLVGHSLTFSLVLVERPITAQHQVQQTPATVAHGSQTTAVTARVVLVVPTFA